MHTRGSGFVWGQKMTTTLAVGTKTSVPRLPRPWVRRARLNDKLTALLPGDVMLVAGFAGSGKTSLLADWFTNDCTVAAGWLSIDHRDNAPGRLADLLARALLVDVSARRQRRQDGTAAVDAILESLASTGARRLLVLDDVQELTSRESLAMLGHLLHYASDRLTVVLSTRADPPISLSRLEIEGRLQQIRSGELAMTTGEIDTLFAAHGFSMADDEVDALHARTEGWAAGVRLVAMAVPAEDDRSRFVAEAVRSDAVISEFLLQEVFEQFPPNMQRFLLRTSVVQKITPELAELLSDEEDAHARLRELEKAGLFVTSADDSAGVYHFHALFGELLRARLRHAEPELACALSGRAARWFQEQGMSTEAEAHAFAAGDWHLAGLLAVQRWVRDAVFGIAGTAPEARAEARGADVVELSLLEALSATSIRDRRNAALWRSRVDAHATEASIDPVLEIARQLLDIEFGRNFGTDARATAAASALLDAEYGADTQRLHALARFRLAELLLETNDEERTLRVVLDARWRASRAAAMWLVERCDALLAVIAAVRGRLDACERLLAPMAADADGTAEMRRLAFALCDVQRGRLQAARTRLAAMPIDPTTSHALRVGLAVTARHLDLVLDDDLHPAEFGSAFAVRVRIATGCLQEGERYVAESQVAVARSLSSRGRYRNVVDLLGRFADGHDQHVRLRTRVEALILVAIAADKLDEPELACRALQRALDLAADVDLRAPFLMYSAPLAEVFDRYGWELGGGGRYAVEIIDDLHPVEPPVFVEPLTERERAVLDYLPTMMSNLEIARHLLVSVNTVKTHLKALYRKLGVDRRRDAVVRARQLELL